MLFRKKWNPTVAKSSAVRALETSVFCSLGERSRKSCGWWRKMSAKPEIGHIAAISGMNPKTLSAMAFSP